jgi:hypothetical protein
MDAHFVYDELNFNLINDNSQEIVWQSNFASLRIKV